MAANGLDIPTLVNQVAMNQLGAAENLVLAVQQAINAAAQSQAQMEILTERLANMPTSSIPMAFNPTDFANALARALLSAQSPAWDCCDNVMKHLELKMTG